MWSKGAVVIVKRGDMAMADAIESALCAKTTIPEKYEMMERDYNIMKVGRESDIQRKIREANNKYGRKKPTRMQRIIAIITLPILWLEVIYAMVVCFLESCSIRFLRLLNWKTRESNRDLDENVKYIPEQKRYY